MAPKQTEFDSMD